MAEATHSGRGLWDGRILVGMDGEEAAHRGRFALPWVRGMLEAREPWKKGASRDAPATLGMCYVLAISWVCVSLCWVSTLDCDLRKRFEEIP